jgi:hypothetical protein
MHSSSILEVNDGSEFDPATNDDNQEEDGDEFFFEASE